MHRRIATAVSTAAVLLALAACGGGGTTPSPNPPPPPPLAPTPVAAVVVTPPTANLVPQQTQALSAATNDASGNALAGRTVTWGTSAGTVATVSASGLVTAVGAGSATITATSEGENGSAVITVADGGQVTTAGGNVDAAGGAVKINVPAGAVAAALAITVTPSATLPTAPATAWITPGASYLFGPEGTTFSAPVTVTIKYDPTKIPVWVVPGDLTLLHYTGGAWVPLTGITVDAVAHTISGQTTGFSPIVAATVLPPVVLSPSPAGINFFQRSVTLTASVPGHPATQTGITYAFTGSNDNGSIINTGPTDPTVQYTYTRPSVPNGDLDFVQVIVRALDPTDGSLVRIGTQPATINGQLVHSFELNPQFGITGFGQTANLDVLVREPDGSVNTTGHFKYIWSTTTFHGDLNIAGPNMVTTTHGVYTANPIGPTTVKVPPRVDKVTVDIYERHDIETQIDLGNAFYKRVVDSSNARYDKVDGTAVAFVEVAPKTSLANFIVRTTPTGVPGGGCVTADVIVTVVPGATSYDLTVFGILGSPTYPTGTAHKVFTGPTNTGSILDIYSTGGGFYGVPLDGGCNTIATAVTARQVLYQNQYGSSPFVVKTTP